VIKGTLFDIQHYAVHDGPGIRTLVFLKGCPLKCAWCCNPESQSFSKQLRYAAFKCTSCYSCIEVCPYHSAKKKDDKVVFDFSICLACEKKTCVENCNSEALMRCGSTYAADEVVAIVKKDIDFYWNSGGGVTFTGGEPLSQAEFLKVMLQGCKEANIHTAIETCGYGTPEDVESIIPYTDMFLFDLKIIDPENHKKYTGRSNEIILENLRRISASGKAVIVRLPLIPGVTDTKENIEQIAEVAIKAGIKEIDLEPYNPLGEEKYTEFGFAAKPEFDAYYSKAELDRIASFFRSKEIACLPA